jgi:TonB family protein
VVEATIGGDGRVSRFETTPGIPDWQLKTAECVMPVPTPDEIESMYRICYPPDELAVVEPHYRVLMTRTGKVRQIELVESTGVPALDQAGVCMLAKLKFQPARHRGMPIETTVVMPIRLRPHR